MKVNVTKELSYPSIENLYCLEAILQGLKAKFRVLVKLGLINDFEADNTRDEITEYKEAVAEMKYKIGAKNCE